VAEACSGLRSISSLSVLALVLGYLLNPRLGARVALFLLAIPTAIGVNVLRIVGTALVAEQDPQLAEGFYHSFSGWLVFLVGFGGLYVQGMVITSWTKGSRNGGNGADQAGNDAPQSGPGAGTSAHSGSGPGSSANSGSGPGSSANSGNPASGASPAPGDAAQRARGSKPNDPGDGKPTQAGGGIRS
jgi:exosortase/archaeosortase family protein